MGTANNSEHLHILALCVFVIGASFVIAPAENGGLRIPVPLIGNYELPAMCMSKIVFDAPCPGCGLTRSFVSLAHGECVTAFLLNPAGPLLFIICLIQIPYRYFKYNQSPSKLIKIIDAHSEKIAWGVLVFMLCAWTTRMFCIYIHPYIIAFY